MGENLFLGTEKPELVVELFLPILHILINTYMQSGHVRSHLAKNEKENHLVTNT